MRLLCPLAAILVTACAPSLPGPGTPPGTACTTEARAGINVTVFDAAGDRVCSAHVIARGEGHEETLEVLPSPDSPDCAYAGLWERAGTFTITATSARFAEVLEKTVTIEQGECHVIAQTIELRATM